MVEQSKVKIAAALIFVAIDRGATLAVTGLAGYFGCDLAIHLIDYGITAVDNGLHLDAFYFSITLSFAITWSTGDYRAYHKVKERNRG